MSMALRLAGDEPDTRWKRRGIATRTERRPGPLSADQLFHVRDSVITRDHRAQLRMRTSSVGADYLRADSVWPLVLGAAGVSPLTSRKIAHESSLPSAARRAAWYWLRTSDAIGAGRSRSAASCR